MLYYLDVAAGTSLSGPTKDSVPIGSGHTGWVGPRQGEVQLPTSCGKQIYNDARHVIVTLKVGPNVAAHAESSAASLVPKLRTILLESAANLSKIYGCADPKSTVPADR